MPFDRKEYMRKYGKRKRKQAAAKKRYRENPDAYRAVRHAARAGKAHEGDVTEDFLRKLYAGWLGVCPLCQREGTPSLDHIQPLAKGGKHSANNVWLICLSCNLRKGKKTLKELLASEPWDL